MARAIWSGAISFGLVNIPVKLYSAVSKKTVRFHQLDSKDNARIQQKRVNPNTGEEVPFEQLVKGYELSPDRYVVVRPEELESIEPKKTRTIDIEDFVEIDQIDPIYYDHPYYLAPGTGAAKPYRLLLEAMKATERVAIARVVIRSKENLVAIRPREDVLTMETLLFGDEVVSPDELDGLDAAEDAKATKKEVDMARQLIDSLSSDFDPSKYKDEYREALLKVIEAKIDGVEIKEPEPVEESANLVDLMKLLQASVKAATDEKTRGSTPPTSVEDAKKARASRSTTKAKPAAKAAKADADEDEAEEARPARRRKSA
jgi:DNA end-binding protein Ku